MRFVRPGNIKLFDPAFRVLTVWRVYLPLVPAISEFVYQSIGNRKWLCSFGRKYSVPLWVRAQGARMARKFFWRG